MSAGPNGHRWLESPGLRLVAGWATCLALLLVALPLSLRVATADTALLLLAEFLSEGARPWLSAATRPPTREPLRLSAGDAANLWRPGGRPPYRGLVLVHGLTPEGKDDRRLAWAAALLARSGIAVMVPDLPGMRAERLRPDDASVVAAAIRRLAADPAVRPDDLVVVGVSVGVAPAIAAAADPATATRVGLVLSLGGYADARELVRYFTSGQYGFGQTSGRVAVQPGLARAFLAANLDLVRDPTDRRAVQAALAGHPLPPSAGPEARAVLAVLENRDPARVDALLAALPAETRDLLDALSPAHSVSRLGAHLLIVHGRGDPAIPHTESLRLAAAAASGHARLVLVDLLGHVEGRVPAWRQASDLLSLWSVVYALLRA